MYKVNDMVVYGNEGVCKITEITSRVFANKTKEYYVLKPVYNENTVLYIPVQSEELASKMKKILSVDEIYEIIHMDPKENGDWIDNDNQRKEKYKEVLRNGDRKEIMKMIRLLYLHQQELKEAGKKFHMADDKFFKDAEKILYDEFAYVLDIKQEDVIPFICKELEEV